MYKKFIGLLAVGAVAAGLLGAPAEAKPPVANEVTTVVTPPIVTAKEGKALKGTAGPKGMPAKAGSVSTQLVTGYHYAGGHEADIAIGVAANVRFENPYREPVAGTHSIIELELEKTIGGTRQIVEVGWMKDSAGDPKLFVFRWVNGVPGTYNGSGYVEYTTYCNTAGAICAGDSVLSWAGTAKQLVIQYFNNAWWIAANGQNIGYFPNTIWTGASPSVTTFTDSDYLQGFGEVYNNSVNRPCTDMGNGLYASTVAPISAYIGSVGYVSQPTTNVNWVGFATNSAEYSANQASTRTVYLGGPGATSTGTTPGNTGSC